MGGSLGHLYTCVYVCVYRKARWVIYTPVCVRVRVRVRV